VWAICPADGKVAKKETAPKFWDAPLIP